MKKIISSLSLIAILGLVNCGGTSSDEAKELLQRVLTVIGIPHNIVLNICQDDNSNGVCEAMEIQTKVSINKDDTLDSIWEKVSLSENGQYFLENYDPTKKILMELQNADKFKFDDGKFTFTYNPSTQELSILQTMVDAGYLEPDDVVAVKKMNAVDDFYDVLLQDTYSNLNTLRGIGLTNRQSTPSAMSEMGDELLGIGIKKEFPEAMNACGDDKKCTDALLEELFKKLLIDEKEAQSILREENNTSEENTEPVIPSSTPLSTVWKTDNSGISEDNEIIIPTDGTTINKNKITLKDEQNAYNYTVDWGDGNIDNNLTGDAIHKYEEVGEYTVNIYGKFPHLFFGKNSDNKANTIESDSRKLVAITQWGDIIWDSMEGAFSECTKLRITANDIPNLSNVTNMKSMFFGAKSFNQDINSWDVSNVIDMGNMFELAISFNQELSSWNVKNVTNMNSMFKGATRFNQNLATWDISSVKDMSEMFNGLTLSTSFYDEMLISWHKQDVQSNVTLDAGYSRYSTNAESPRNDILVGEKKWTITDGGVIWENSPEEEQQHQY